MYESPIKFIMDQMKVDYENGVFKAIQKVDIEVDRDELIRALRYDRDQYKKGFEDGYKAGRCGEVIVREEAED